MLATSFSINAARSQFLQSMVDPHAGGTRAPDNAARRPGLSISGLGNAPAPGRVPIHSAQPLAVLSVMPYLRAAGHTEHVVCTAASPPPSPTPDRVTAPSLPQAGGPEPDTGLARFNRMLARMYTPPTWAQWTARSTGSTSCRGPAQACAEALARVRALRDPPPAPGAVPTDPQPSGGTSGNACVRPAPATSFIEPLAVRSKVKPLDHIGTYLHSVRGARKVWHAREIEAAVARPEAPLKPLDEALPALPAGLADAMRAKRLQVPERARLEDLLRGHLPKRVPHFQKSHPSPLARELQPTGMYLPYMASRA